MVWMYGLGTQCCKYYYTFHELFVKMKKIKLWTGNNSVFHVCTVLLKELTFCLLLKISWFLFTKTAELYIYCTCKLYINLPILKH